MSKSSYYFSKSVIEGLGDVFCLRVPRSAAGDKGAGNLLGSLVEEDDGLFGSSPIPIHAHVAQSVLKAMIKLGTYTESDFINRTELAGVTTTLDKKKQLKANGSGEIPGSPVAAGFALDYTKVKSIDVTLGAGSVGLNIGEALLEECYQALKANEAAYPKPFFGKDLMLVDQVVLVSNLSITVHAEGSFDAGFNAKVQSAGAVGGGVSFHSESESSYSMKLEGDVPYLFALSAIKTGKLWK